ncbi:MAG: Tol-Pal system beta propeller repeat protein TolB [Syntrophaceae bacterium]|nr:Tol-Pal system beta propeller repeat protein TolB [Syntrophaceae bacterium]
MKKTVYFGTLLLLFSALLAHHLAAKVYIDIRSPSFRKFPLAIFPFQSLLPTNREMQLGERATEILKNDLDISGFFTLIAPSEGAEKTGLPAAGGDPSAKPGEDRLGAGPQPLNFQPWANLGAEALVVGNLFYRDGSLTLEARLYDVVKKELIVGKRYVGEITDLSRMVHRFADEIIYALTGEQGFFQTKIIFVSQAGGFKELYMMDYDGRNVFPITNHKSTCLSPRVSPDGRWVLFTSYKFGNPDLFLKDLQTGEEKRISSHPGLNISPAWSPDGKRIALTLSKDGNSEIYAMNPDGSGLTRLTNHPDIDVSPTWSPDGQRIAFVSSRGGTPQIYVMSANGQNVQRLTFEGNYNTHPAWSPRGERIAFDASMGGGRNICLMNSDGSDLRVLTANMGQCEMPSWSPDGRHLVFSATRDGDPRIFLMNAEGTRIKRLTFQKGSDTYPYWVPRNREIPK